MLAFLASSLVAAQAPSTPPPPTPALPHGGSHWDRLPIELRDAVLAVATPQLAWFDRRRPLLDAEAASLAPPARRRLWIEALETEWPGRLDTLPFVHWDPSLTLAIRSRRMLARVCAFWETSNQGDMHGVDAQRLCIRRGWTDLLCFRDAAVVAEAAAGEGATVILKALYRTFRLQGRLTDLVHRAAEGGNLETVQWLCGCSWSPTASSPSNAVYAAAGSGNLELVKWLVGNGHAIVGTMAVENAAEHGHLHIVRWLADKTVERLHACVFSRACTNGHVDVLEFLRVRYPEVFGRTTDHTFEGARHVHALAWLKQHCPHMGFEECLRRACCSDNVDAAAWILENTATRVRQDMVVAALKHGALAVLQWMIVKQNAEINLHDYFSESCCTNTVVLAWGIRHDGRLASVIAERAALDRKWPLLDWLHVRYPGSLKTGLIEAVIDAGQLGIAGDLIARFDGVDWDLARARELAVRAESRSLVQRIDARIGKPV
ncbi:hypothetical protein HK105_201231 [Polyrhizophydium stewartii]|uniref:Ankyrin repeat protein n=1 Tax=Polyrhizophydium stewartii TaxID=2732419 RepID=A0ABR4NHL7_9FUNG